MKRNRIATAVDAARMAITYAETGSLEITAKRHGRSITGLIGAMTRHGYYQSTPRRPWVTDEEVAAMGADYESGLTLAAVARKHGRDRDALRQIFVRRGLKFRPLTKKYGPTDPKTGCYLPAKPLTAAQIDAMIATEPKLRVPWALKLEWRKWSIERRGDFIRRLRARLNSPKDRPTTPFSDNVEPFDYASTRAWKILKRENAGLTSRDWKLKFDICSQGVIWRDELWFWCHKSGYHRMGPWTPGSGRPTLHHIIWEELHGPVPASHVVRFADGNRNNFEPSNFVLAHRNEVARENQAAALFRKSRERTSLLLARAQRQKPDENTSLLYQLETR